MKPSATYRPIAVAIQNVVNPRSPSRHHQDPGDRQDDEGRVREPPVDRADAAQDLGLARRIAARAPQPPK
jgi:hypothetical protein